MLITCLEFQKLSGSSSPMILVINKIDCTKSPPMGWPGENGNTFCKQVLTCAVTGQGIQELEAAISEIVGLNRVPKGGRRWIVNQVINHFYVNLGPIFVSKIFFLICISCILGRMRAGTNSFGLDQHF